MTNTFSIKAIILLLLYMSGTGCNIEFGHIYRMYPGGKRLKICKPFIRLRGWLNKRSIIELFWESAGEKKSLKEKHQGKSADMLKEKHKLCFVYGFEVRVLNLDGYCVFCFKISL